MELSSAYVLLLISQVKENHSEASICGVSYVKPKHAFAYYHSTTDARNSLLLTEVTWLILFHVHESFLLIYK